MQMIQVGKPFPGPVPSEDGVIFEIGSDGMPVLLIQYHHPSPAEEAALKAGFERYSILETSVPPHLACWVWQFPAPVGYIDAPFHVGLYTDGRMEKFLRHWGNHLQIYVLDGRTVKIIRTSGLSFDAADALRAIVRRQLSAPIDQASHDAALTRLFSLDSEEIFSRGVQFRHGKTPASAGTEVNQQGPRPLRHLNRLAKQYPHAWKLVDEFRASQGKDLPAWPKWCFLPMGGWYAIVSGAMGGEPVPFHLVHDIGRLAAVGTWRYSQGIYSFDPETYAAVIDTPLNGDLPNEVLLRLPEWGIYIETPGLSFGGVPLHGFFAHLEWDAKDGHPELRLCLDTDADLLPFPLHLGKWSICEGLERTYAPSIPPDMLIGSTLSGLLNFFSYQAEQLAPLLSLLLYLCSDEPEISLPGAPRPGISQPKRTKTGWRLFPAPKPTIWTVGKQTGEKLRQAAQANRTAAATGRTVRPHLRRAHWHGYWTGPRDGERRFGHRWLAPIFVSAVHDAGDKANHGQPPAGQ